jgi:hypothetical protein
VRTTHHSPLREHARYALSQRLKPVVFTDPKLSVCVPLEGSTLTTAEEVRAMFLQNKVEPLRVERMVGPLASYGAQIGVAVGPSMREALFMLLFPIVNVASPESFREATTQVRRAGEFQSAINGSAT